MNRAKSSDSFSLTKKKSEFRMQIQSDSKYC